MHVQPIVPMDQDDLTSDLFSFGRNQDEPSGGDTPSSSQDSSAHFGAAEEPDAPTSASSQKSTTEVHHTARRLADFLKSLRPQAVSKRKGRHPYTSVSATYRDEEGLGTILDVYR